MDLYDGQTELDYCRGLLKNMVIQHCSEKNGKYFSGFIGINADAMRYLGEVGLLDVNDCGGRVVEAVEK